MFSLKITHNFEKRGRICCCFIKTNKSIVHFCILWCYPWCSPSARISHFCSHNVIRPSPAHPTSSANCYCCERVFILIALLLLRVTLIIWKISTNYLQYEVNNISGVKYDLRIKVQAFWGLLVGCIISALKSYKTFSVSSTTVRKVIRTCDVDINNNNNNNIRRE